MIKICIIEDTIEINEGLIKMLNKDTRFEVLGSYGNAEDAILCIPDLNPDIVIADINLPNKSGIEGMRIIKEIKPEIQFVMFTIYEDTDQIFDALQSGANGYILKNTKPKLFAEFLEEVYRGGSPMSSPIARKVIDSFKQTPHTKVEDILTEREYEILLLLSKGFLYKEISNQLNIVISTVKSHIKNIYYKLQVKNKTEAVNILYGKNASIL